MVQSGRQERLHEAGIVFQNLTGGKTTEKKVGVVRVMCLDNYDNF